MRFTIHFSWPCSLGQPQSAHVLDMQLPHETLVKKVLDISGRLRGLVQLRELDLCGRPSFIREWRIWEDPEMDDQYLEPLKALTLLNKLHLPKTKGWTEQGMLALLMDLPNVSDDHNAWFGPAIIDTSSDDDDSDNDDDDDNDHSDFDYGIDEEADNGDSVLEAAEEEQKEEEDPGQNEEEEEKSAESIEQVVQALCKLINSAKFRYDEGHQTGMGVRVALILSMLQSDYGDARTQHAAPQ